MMLEILSVILFVLLNVADVLSTQIAIHNFHAYEGNTLVHYFHEKFGLTGHVIIKIISVGLYIVALDHIVIEALFLANIIFALIVVSNLWVMINDT